MTIRAHALRSPGMFGLRNLLRFDRSVLSASQLVLGGKTPTAAQNLLRLEERIRDPVRVERAELLRHRGRFFVRLRSTDGVEGVALGSARLIDLLPVIIRRVLPLFVGHDVRSIERMVDEVGRHDDNYKLGGLAFWSCVAGIELAAFDLMGKTAEVSATEHLLVLTAGDRLPKTGIILPSPSWRIPKE
jgi:hypothetical protein